MAHKKNQNMKNIKDSAIQLSIHYYVLSLSEKTSRLYEAFRDNLIDIQNSNFPIESGFDVDSIDKPVEREIQLRKFLEQTDRNFAHYYNQDPLRLVVVGEKRCLNIFEALKTCPHILIGMVEGDYTTTSPHDLGKIVWPVVKETISGANQNALRELASAAKTKKIVSGIEAVGQSAEKGMGAILYVEEDYKVKGSLQEKGSLLVISKHVNIWNVIDDVVDLIIEKVLKMNGEVIFMKNGSLMKFERIALVLD